MFHLLWFNWPPPLGLVYIREEKEVASIIQNMLYYSHIQLEYHSNSLIPRLPFLRIDSSLKSYFILPPTTLCSFLISDYSKLCFKELLMYYLSSSWEAETMIDSNPLYTSIWKLNIQRNEKQTPMWPPPRPWSRPLSTPQKHRRPPPLPAPDHTPFPVWIQWLPSIHGYHFLTFLQMFTSLFGISTDYSSAFINFEHKWNIL